MSSKVSSKVYSTVPSKVSPGQDAMTQWARTELTASCVHPEFLGEAVSEIHDNGNWDVQQALDRRVSTNWQTRAPWSYVSAIAFHNEDGSLFQVKPSNPRIAADTERPVKYESPALMGADIASPFMPAVGDEVRGLIGQRYGVTVPTTEKQPSFWAWVARTKLQVVLTEGAKKSLALLSQGHIAIGLTGVFAGVRSFSGHGEDRAKLVESELTPALTALARRPWVLAMDRDSNAKTVRVVSKAKDNLAFHLSRAGASLVGDATWTAKYKGADDLIAGLGPDAIHEAIGQAANVAHAQKVRRLKARVSRKADISITGDFSKIPSYKIPSSGLVVFRGGKGTGKSTAITNILNGRTWLSVTALQSLGRQQAKSWGGTFYNDTDRAGGRIIDENQNGLAYSVCVPSLRAVSNLKPEVLVVDETTATQRFLLESSLANKNGCRQFLIEGHDALAATAGLVVLADADMDEATIAHYETVTGHTAFLIESSFTPLGWTGHVIDGDTNKGVGALISHLRNRDLGDGRLVFVSTDSKRHAERLAQVLENQIHNPLKTLLITSETGANPDVRALLSSNGLTLPSLVAMGYGAIVASPSVTQGFSIHSNTNLIDSVWGLYVGGSITPAAAAQALDRVRDESVARYINAPTYSQAPGSHSKATSAEQWLEDLKESTDLNHKIVVRDLVAPSDDVLMGADRINWDSPSLKLAAHYAADKNLTSAQFKGWLLANLENEGKTIEEMATAPQDGAEAKNHMSAAKTVVEAERADRIVSAEILSPKDAALLSDKAVKTLAESSALERFHAARFYNELELTSEVVIADDRGRRRSSIIRAEYALNNNLAVAASAASIAKSNLPTDQDKAAILTFVGEVTGVNELVRSILNEETTHLEADTVLRIAANLRSYSRQVKLLFGFRDLDKISDQQLVGQMLDRFGIKTTRTPNGYDVHQAAVAEIVAIIKKRGVAPLRSQPAYTPTVYTWKSEYERQQLVKAGLIAADYGIG